MMSLSRARLEGLLRAFPELGVAVVGDFALDAYWTADMTRSELSRETPRFPLPIVEERYSPGAAGNVAANVAALGVGRVFAISVLGDDWRGRILREELARRGVEVSTLLTAPDRVTCAYIKPIRRGYESEQEDARLDFDNYRPLAAEAEERLLAAVAACLPQVKAVAVCDQMAQGVLTPRVREGLIALAEEHPEVVFCADSRYRIGLFRAMVLKPNELEAARARRPNRSPHEISREELQAIGMELARQARRPVYITVGADGALLFHDDRLQHLPAPRAQPPIDTVGAGDTFLAALCASLAAGARPEEAGALANLATAVTIKKLHTTGTASPAELRAKYEEALGR
jgi:rfaE bifunctional protein kinase chain/domain